MNRHLALFLLTWSRPQPRGDAVRRFAGVRHVAAAVWQVMLGGPLSASRSWVLTAHEFDTTDGAMARAAALAAPTTSRLRCRDRLARRGIVFRGHSLTAACSDSPPVGRLPASSWRRGVCDRAALVGDRTRRHSPASRGDPMLFHGSATRARPMPTGSTSACTDRSPAGWGAGHDDELVPISQLDGVTSLQCPAPS